MYCLQKVLIMRDIKFLRDDCILVQHDDHDDEIVFLFLSFQSEKVNSLYILYNYIYLFMIAINISIAQPPISNR